MYIHISYHMPATIAKWGNSIALRIPAYIAEQANLKEGDQCNISCSPDQQITVQKIPKIYSFHELYKNIDTNTTYSEISLGTPIGKELVTW